MFYALLFALLCFLAIGLVVFLRGVVGGSILDFPSEQF